jgi:hypothetical protein
MRIEVSKIKYALGKLKPAINQNDKYLYGKYIYISNLMLMGYNEVTQIYYLLESEGADFESILEVKELNKFLAKVKDTHLDMFKEGDKIIIKGKNVKYTIKEDINILDYFQRYLNDIDFEWKKLPDDFLYGLRLVVQSADSSPGYYNRVIVENDRILSTDSYRAARYTMDTSFNYLFCLPYFVCIDILKNTYTKYYIKKSIVYLTNEDENLIYKTSLNTDGYKDVEEILQYGEGEGIELKLPDDMADYIDLSYIAVDDFIEEMHQLITVKIENNKMHIIGDSESKRIEIDIEYESELEELNFTINPGYFKDIVEKIQTIKILDDIIVFYDDNFTHLFSLGE